MGIVILLIVVPLVLWPLGGRVLKSYRMFQDRRRSAPQPPPQRPAPADDGWGRRVRMVRRAMATHIRTETRWLLEYERDLAKLLDFPAMIDMRNPLTERFHRAKPHAALTMPGRAHDVADDPEAARRYVEAVEEFVSAFDAAEADAIRRRRSDFSADAQQRFDRAQDALRIAADAATTPGRRRLAYELARLELEDLVVLPPPVRTAIERGIAGEIGR
ncbi:hypothetical protein [uncultured Mycolicibacterium sp.]|uniref:hypothetical protein n=1 Tax=uncultured Mycolicibacterium sp. TaxID=2320817 RepID=UPI00260ED407|nr:hypothetical protein [uncultured Mycolicibacterium sp.]